METEANLMGRADSKIKRFGNFRIAEHWANAAVFMTLVVTGLCQKFYMLSASQWIVLHLNGIDTVRLIHRTAGIMLIIIMMRHVLAASCGAIISGKRPQMLITAKDFLDVVEDLRYYFGLAKRPALCDRFNYKQKFEYWAILAGQTLMILSGLVLWFPIEVTRLLPGEIVPAAKELHTNEALVVVIITAVWHIYNSIFSPEVFPLDTSIFTGYIPRARMAREHPLELARIEGRPVEEITGINAGDSLKIRKTPVLPL